MPDEKRDISKIPSFLQSLFEDKVELLPSVNELFELELAYLEYNCLPKSDLLDRLAYFRSVNGEYTKHFLMYNQPTDALTDNRSAHTKAYFENGLFSTGYATHGLFPYRGKFHPQLIKALINVIGIKKGETIGYNRAYKSLSPIKTATIPIGHADGIGRQYGNRNGFVTINNQKAYIIGNVCMDMIMVDITNIDCTEGDEVIIFGKTVTAEDFAHTTNTISYEIITSISRRIKRIIIK